MAMNIDWVGGMGNLKLKCISRLAFDPSYPDIDQRNFQECGQTDFYEGTVELIPLNAPLPKEKKVDLHLFINCNHADNTQDQVHDIYEVSLINGYSKKQSTIKISVFYAESIIIKVGAETLHVIQYVKDDEYPYIWAQIYL